jgi:hypothetical protein
VPNQNTKKHLEEVKEFEKSGYAFFFLFVKIADHTTFMSKHFTKLEKKDCKHLPKCLKKTKHSM